MKGKHAGQAATRRATDAQSKIAELERQLAEAKARARRVEADAARLPAVEGEMTRLRGLIAEGTSDALEKERAAHRATKDADRELLLEAVRRCFDWMAKSGAKMPADEYEWFRKHVAPLGDLHEVFQQTRITRRNAAYGNMVELLD